VTFIDPVPFSGLIVRGGLSRRAAGLQPSLKNVRQKIPPNGQTRLQFGFSYENFTTQSFSVLPTPFLLNVSQESNKTNVSLFSNDALMRGSFQHTCRWIWRFRGCRRHSPKGKKPNILLQKTWWYIRLSQSVFDILTMNFLRKNGGNMIFTAFYYLNFLDIEFYNYV